MPTFVRHLGLVDVRNYEALELELAPGVTAFVGPNGQGKTNLVEAVGYLSTLGSHRVATDAPLIRAGCDRAVIKAEVVRDDRSIVVEMEINAGQANKARINRSPVPRTREILGLLRAVVFAPEDLTLVKGDPAERRAFLDGLLVQRLPRIAGVRGDYDRVLKQRNALLKSAGAARRSHSDEIDRTLVIWDEQLASLGAELMNARADLVERLQPWAAQDYSGLAGSGPTLGLAYRPSVDVDAQDVTHARDALMSALLRGRKEELDRGITLVGPHRDELALAIGDLPVKGYASHGESWSAALALRLAAYDMLAAENEAPVLILDDVFAELDTSRREQLAKRVQDAPQVLVTAAVEGDVPGFLRATRFDVVQGMVTRHD